MYKAQYFSNINNNKLIWKNVVNYILTNLGDVRELGD